MNRSDLHYEMINLIKQAFPLEKIKESVIIRLDGKNLEFDALLVSTKCFVEFHGQQHYKHVKFFQKTKRDFVNQQYRDMEKYIYCTRNGYSYIEIPFDHERTAEAVKTTILKGMRN